MEATTILTRGAIALISVAVGFFLRFKGRRGLNPELQLSTSPLARLVAVVLSVSEVAALVEATNLPVRFNQAGFQLAHWYLVALALFSAYLIQVKPIANLLRGSKGKSAA
jgi:hypothetical protein